MRALVLMALAAVVAAGDLDYASLDQRAMLGVHMSPPSPATQFENGTTPDVGVEVLHIYGDTTAERMGVRVGDLILTVNGGDIGMMGDLRNEVGLAGVGGQVTVELLRDGRKLTMDGTLDAWPEHIPQEPLDVAAEERFRRWQEQRWQRITGLADALDRQVAALEAQPWATEGRALIEPQQAAALQAAPAFRLRLHIGHDTPDRRKDIPERRTRWDARVLIGTPAPPIH